MNTKPHTPASQASVVAPRACPRARQRWLPRCVAGSALLALLCACGKHDASAGSLAGGFNQATQQAGRKFEQAASAMGDQVDAAASSARETLSSTPAMPAVSASEMAGSVRANAASAASATGAALADATYAAGRGLEIAGQKLQAVASGAEAASAPAEDSGVTASSSRQ